MDQGAAGRVSPAGAVNRPGAPRTRAAGRRGKSGRKGNAVGKGADGGRPLAVRFASVLLRLLRVGPVAVRGAISEAELRDLVAANRAIDGEERRIIDEVLAAGGRHVREVMVPRTDVVFLDGALTLPVAGSIIRTARYSRFPVIDGSHDDVIGFVHLRDLLIRPEHDGAATVGGLAREIKRLPAGKRVLPALSEMRREGHHLAVVVDEYGGTAGIVTLEDLIEELVGEITDEYDLAPDPVPVDGTLPAEVDGRLNLADFAGRTGIALPPGPYETVAGFLMARLGRLPGVGDEVPVEAAGCRLVVAAVEGRRVARVALRPGTPVVPAQATGSVGTLAATQVDPSEERRGVAPSET